MAFASENTWYKGSMSLYKITEINIVSAYNTTGNETETWDGSAELDGSVMCYRKDDKVIVKSPVITEVTDKMFAFFLSLKKISGLSSATTIGARAFCLTPNLTSIDITPSNLTSIGESAFKMSSVEDALDLSSVSLNIIGDKATRRKRWSDDELIAISGVEFTRTVFPSVPNLDCQMLYSDVLYGIKKDSSLVYADRACKAFSYYHVWNHLFAGTDKQYDSWVQWYNDTINADGEFAENNPHDTPTNAHSLICSRLGWTFTSIEYVNSEEHLRYIVERLSNGFPVIATIHSNNTIGKHVVAIVGCDASSRKLAVADSGATDDIGVIYWVSFEDMFVRGTDDTDRIAIVNYNYPILASGDTWFSKGGTNINRASITEIDVKDSYVPNGNETVSWDASAANDGSVTAYVNGTKLIIAGNGSGKVWMHPNSSWVFSDSNKADYFLNMSVINGGDILDTSKSTTMEYMFNNSRAITTIDTSNWNTSNVTSMRCMFQNCMMLSRLDVSKWNTSSLTTTFAMFNMTGGTTNIINRSLYSLDVSNWDVSKVTSMFHMFPNCMSLTELDVSNWNTVEVTNMTNMFAFCESIKELNLSNWDTSKVTSMSNMFSNMKSLEKITIGDHFTAIDVGIASPDPTYITGADGNWYDINYKTYTLSTIPSNVMRTYYATKNALEKDASQIVHITKGTVMRIAETLRSKTGKTTGLMPSQFVDEIASLS